MPATSIEPPPEHFDVDDQPPDEFDGDEGGDGGDPIRWTTVATFWTSPEAHMARLKLESEEIDCFIVDENVIATQWLWANALGGVKLQVPQAQLEQARQILHDSVPATQASDGEPLYDGQERCLQCGSSDIHLQRYSRRLAFLTILLLGAPIPLLRRNQRCEKCGFEWKP